MIGALGYHTHILYFLGINHRGNLLSGWIDGFVTAARKNPAAGSVPIHCITKPPERKWKKPFVPKYFPESPGGILRFWDRKEAFHSEFSTMCKNQPQIFSEK